MLFRANATPSSGRTEAPYIDCDVVSTPLCCQRPARPTNPRSSQVRILVRAFRYEGFFRSDVMFYAFVVLSSERIGRCSSMSWHWHLGGSLQISAAVKRSSLMCRRDTRGFCDSKVLRSSYGVQGNSQSSMLTSNEQSFLPYCTGCFRTSKIGLINKFVHEQTDQ